MYFSRTLQDATRIGRYNSRWPRNSGELWVPLSIETRILQSEQVYQDCFGFDPVISQLHQLANASEMGYCTVSYLLLENADGERHCSLIMGKSRVAPFNQTTIPRLELTAASAAVKTNKILLTEINMHLDCIVFWTEVSLIRYLQNRTARFRTFVANRQAMIHEGSQPSILKIHQHTNQPRWLSIKRYIGHQSYHAWILDQGPEFFYLEPKD